MNPDTERRKVIYAMAHCAMRREDFTVLAEVVRLSEIGTEQEREHCLAEWRAEHAGYSYSIFPQYGYPRLPRPSGSLDDEDEA